MRHVLKFLTRLPLPVLYALGTFAYIVAFHVLRWHRELAARNLAAAFPEKNIAMAVLLVGRQCCVSRSAMERYDARFWRNSVMTYFAGSKSWNFCGRNRSMSPNSPRTRSVRVPRRDSQQS